MAMLMGQAVSRLCLCYRLTRHIQLSTQLGIQSQYQYSSHHQQQKEIGQCSATQNKIHYLYHSHTLCTPSTDHPLRSSADDTTVQVHGMVNIIILITENFILQTAVEGPFAAVTHEEPIYLPQQYHGLGTPGFLRLHQHCFLMHRLFGGHSPLGLPGRLGVPWGLLGRHVLHA